MKFMLYDFLGEGKGYFLVSEEVIPPEATKPVKQIGHLCLVLDASGSMWGDMAAMRSLVEKLLTLEEYRDSSVLVSILSFSSSGDLMTHVSRVPISSIMEVNSPYLAAVKNIQARGLTCISQGLQSILPLVQPSELTAAVVVSDGFANDRSPGAEKREIDTYVDQLRKLPNVFVNTVALRDWADYKLLSYIANACSGTCFQAPTAKEVFEVLHATTSLLAGSTAPAITLPVLEGEFVVFTSASAHKTLGSSTSELVVRGLRPEDDKLVYRYKQVEQAVWKASSAPICGDGDVTIKPLLAFATTQLAMGNLNRAKYAVVSTRDQTLLSKHARSLVNADIQSFAKDLEDVLYNPEILFSHQKSVHYGLPNAHVPSVLQILGILGEHATDIEVNLSSLRGAYKRRSVKRVAGTRLEDGTIQAPRIKTAFRDAGDWVRVSSFDINRNTATINMLTRRPIRLLAGDQPIDVVAGISLDKLQAFNNYTVVGDGELNIPSLHVRLSNKRLFRALANLGVLPEGDFDPQNTYVISFDGRPLVAYNITFEAAMFQGLFNKLARYKTLTSILTACLDGKSDIYTDAQLEELTKHYLSSSLFVSLPTTTEYVDLKQALSDGVIDTRLSYKVDFGLPSVLNLSDLYSANEYLQRRFTAVSKEILPAKLTLTSRMIPEITYAYKALSARTKLNAVDDLMFPIFEDFLGTKFTGVISEILGSAKADADFVAKFLDAAHGKRNVDSTVEIFKDALKLLSKATETEFEKVSSLVFYIGATGLVPDEFQATAMTAEQVKIKYPELSVGKAQADATFYDIAGTLLSVYVKAEYFSTGKEVSALEDVA